MSLPLACLPLHAPAQVLDPSWPATLTSTTQLHCLTWAAGGRGILEAGGEVGVSKGEAALPLISRCSAQGARLKAQTRRFWPAHGPEQPKPKRGGLCGRLDAPHQPGAVFHRESGPKGPHEGLWRPPTDGPASGQRPRSLLPERFVLSHKQPDAYSLLSVSSGSSPCLSPTVFCTDSAEPASNTSCAPVGCLQACGALCACLEHQCGSLEPPQATWCARSRRTSLRTFRSFGPRPTR